MPNVIIYTTPTCKFCIKVKEFMTNHNIKFSECDISTDAEADKEMRKITGQSGVPVIRIDDEFVVGYNKNFLEEKLLPKVEKVGEVCEFC